jgi:hypothetical protein
MILKKYSDFINEAKSRFPKGSDEVYKQGTILANMKPEEFLKTKNCYQEEDGKWSCDGDFVMNKQPHAPIFKDGKLIIEFKTIKGMMHVLDCGLISLEGFPEEVGTLKPTNINSNSFSVNDNPITSLVGMPKKVGGPIDINGTLITDLQGAPEAVNGNFRVGYNDMLTSLKGGPKVVLGELELNQSPLTDLQGAPEFVNGRLVIAQNDQLTSLNGAPKTVGKLLPVAFKSLKNVPEIEKEWYGKLIEGDEGYNHYFEDLLKYIIKTKQIGQIDTVHWPEGFLDENFKRSASGVKKYKL